MLGFQLHRKQRVGVPTLLSRLASLLIASLPSLSRRFRRSALNLSIKGLRARVRACFVLTFPRMPFTSRVVIALGLGAVSLLFGVSLVRRGRKQQQQARATPITVVAMEEKRRLEDDAARAKNWKRWGPYLSERQWATVREDYSHDGNAWDNLPFSRAHMTAYRWGEDGLLGFTDRECRLCFSLALWNGRDAILKERLYGLTNEQGNHGEDVKEAYFYSDSSPTHSYCRSLYKYPHSKPFPYEWLAEENKRRSRQDQEFELQDTGAFAHYFDICAEYAKADDNDILIQITATNRSEDTASPLHILPTLWFRNTWSWGCGDESCWKKPAIRRVGDTLRTDHETLEPFSFESVDDGSPDSPAEWIFTENVTNFRRLYGVENETEFTKDAFDRLVVHGDANAVRPASQQRGTKTARLLRWASVQPGQTVTVKLRLRRAPADAKATHPATSGAEFDGVFATRMAECDAFYRMHIPQTLSADEQNVVRQAYAGLLFSKQYYHYIVRDWLAGDPNFPPPPRERKSGRNSDWSHFHARDIILMPDKWEYPWPAVWDLAFQVVAIAPIDPDLAKSQLLLFLREWYMHPNGCLPAYEWNFGDVNPPVHAWAVWTVYRLTSAPARACVGSNGVGVGDTEWLARCFQKLIINFTWWVNRKDPDGNHIFAGGFLGLDNIGVFDRSKPLPSGLHYEQADGTAWMAFYAIIMLKIAIELAQADRSYEDLASKFFEHFVGIADAMNSIGGNGLWNDEDAFYYDKLRAEHQGCQGDTLRVRSMVGIIPLFAVGNIPSTKLGKLDGFVKRMQWFLTNRKDLASQVSMMEVRRPNGSGAGEKAQTPSKDDNYVYHLAIPNAERLTKVLRYVLSETEFLSPFGVRSLSKYHASHPYSYGDAGVSYVPGESDTGMFGGNSNWRGPIWFPVNYLLIESLEHFHHFYGDGVRCEFPTGSGNWVSLGDAAVALAERLGRIFLKDARTGNRPCNGGDAAFASDPNWSEHVLFHEYFHGDTGRGLGATHQTGWTALVATCLTLVGRHRVREGLASQPWFIGKATEEEAEAHFASGKGGKNFVVRATQTPDTLSVCTKGADGEFRHRLVVDGVQGFSAAGFEKAYETIEELAMELARL